MAGLLDGLLESWREYAASREGMGGKFVPMPASFGDRFSGQAPASAGGAVPGMPGAAPPMAFDPLLAGGPGVSLALPVDPYAAADEKAKKAKARQFGPFSGLLNAPYRMAGGPGSAPLDMPPSTNDPQAQEPEVFKDGVPLPRPRPDSGLNGQTGAPLSLAPPDPSESAQLPPAAAPAGPATTYGGLGDIGDGLKSALGKIFDPNHAATWMALGSGFAGAPNIGQGISRASAAAVPAMAADRANEMKQTGIAATYKALVARGVPPAEALAAVYNPDVMKATAAKYFETKPLTPHTVTDAFGGQSMVVFNPNTGQFMGPDGKPVAPGSAGTPGSQKEYLAKGVTEVNHDLGGEDYLNQFSPEVKQAAKDYVAGRSTPTGNPRKGFTQQVKMIAAKYGNDIGLPADDTSFAARRTMRNQLSSATPASVGGQRNAGNVMIGHLSEVADRAHSLGNWDTGIFPDLAHGINWARAHASTAQAAKVNGLNDAVQRYVAEVEKYYAGSQGAQSARDAAEKRFMAARTPQEFAEAIKAERHLAESKLQTVDGQIKTVLGPLASEYPAITKESEKYLGQIDKTVAALEGRGGSASAAPAAPVAPLAPGQTTTIGEVKIRRIN